MQRGQYRHKRCLRTPTGPKSGRGESHIAGPEGAAHRSEKTGFLRSLIRVFLARRLAFGLPGLIEQTRSRTHGRVRAGWTSRTCLKRAERTQTGKRIDRLRDEIGRASCRERV